MATGWGDRHNSPMIARFNLGMQLSFIDSHHYGGQNLFCYSKAVELP